MGHGRLLVTVTDDGNGGARVGAGGGLAGLVERVGTVDGEVHVDSPAGGPTVVRVELPGHS
jgi:signal transduction histidine kinase